MIRPTEAIACPEECRCEWEGYLVDCSYSGLNSILSILPTHVRHLVLDGNRITFLEIIPGVFEKISSQEFLYLGNNVIEHLDSDAFSGVVNLNI